MDPNESIMIAASDAFYYGFEPEQSKSVPAVRDRAANRCPTTKEVMVFTKQDHDFFSMAMRCPDIRSNWIAEAKQFELKMPKALAMDAMWRQK